MPGYLCVHQQEEYGSLFLFQTSFHMSSSSSNSRLLHIVVVFNTEENEIIVITPYEPDEIYFESGKKRRSL